MGLYHDNIINNKVVGCRLGRTR